MKIEILLLPCLLNPLKMPPFGSFCQKIHVLAFFQGEAITMCTRPPNTLLHPFCMEKDLKSKCSKIFSEPKTPKGGYFKGVKEKGGNEGGEYGSSHFST